MKQEAEGSRGQALQREELPVKEVRRDRFARNRRGHSLSKRVRVLEKQVANIPALMTTIGSLQNRVSSLTCSLEAYNLLRNRFISAFKRDKLEKATDRDRRIIGAGNSWAHGGDAVFDAQLYEGQNGRRDFYAYKTLYGFLPETVQKICE